MKRTLILGASGQDGTLLTRAVARQGGECLGLNSKGVLGRDGQLAQAGKIDDVDFVRGVIGAFAPTHVYYVAAHHHSSQDTGIGNDANLWRDSLQVQVVGLVNVLEGLRAAGGTGRLFYASSSHVFGTPKQSPQNEETPLVPENVYAITKVTGMEACRHYREKHGLFASSGILYNHESVLRKEKFLTRKIVLTALAIKAGTAKELVIGDLSARIDWGYAPDYVEAMVRILDLPEPGTFVIATGEAHTVREFVEIAFTELGLDYREWVKENASIVRPSLGGLVGDAGKLRRATQWAPSVSFPEMVRRLIAETREQAAA